MTGSTIDVGTQTSDQGHDDAHGDEFPAGRNAVDLVVEGLRTLGHDRSLGAVTRLITTAAMSSLTGAVDAAVTMRAGKQFRTVAPTSDLPPTVDALQYEHGGPCVDAVLTTTTVLLHGDDLRVEHRWPTFTAAALADTPVLSMLSYRLFVAHHDESFGSLNLYAIKPHAFDPATVTAGERLAAYAGVMLAYAAEREKALHLERALHSSRDIGAAIGILMTRRLVTREHAFELLTTAGKHYNRRLREVADEVIRTGDLPTPAADQNPRTAHAETSE